MSEQKAQIALEHLKAGEYDLALVLYNALTTENPFSADYFGYRGAVLLNLKRKKEALQDFNKAVELEPEYSYRYASRAFAKDALGDLSGAIEDYRIAVTLDPDDAIAHNNLGLLEEKIGNQANAQKHFKTADAFAAEYFQQEKEIRTDVEYSENIFENNRVDDSSTPGASDYLQELKKVFSSKDEFSRFITFIKKGFKR